LLAAEMMLAQQPDHHVALDVLRGLGRQSHRETALAIAKMLQTYLGLDMGLPTDGPVAANSKVAADVAKRVLQWATGRAAAGPAVPEGETRTVEAPPRPPSVVIQRPPSQVASTPRPRPPAGRGSSPNVWVPS
jgi:hypothetical protein